MFYFVCFVVVVAFVFCCFGVFLPVGENVYEYNVFQRGQITLEVKRLKLLLWGGSTVN